MKSGIRRNMIIALFSVTLVTLFVLIYFVPSVYNVFTPTMLAEYKRVQVTDDIEGYIVREETLYFANKEGIVETLAPEGEKIRRKEKVIRVTGYSVEKNENMLVINDRINKFTSGSNIFANDLNKLDSLIRKKQDQLKSAQKRNNASEQRDLKDKIARLEAKRLVISGPDAGLTDSAAVSSDEASGVQDKLEALAADTQRKNAEDPLDAAGFVSYYVDGYETEFTPENMYMLNRDKAAAQEYTLLNTYQMAVRRGDPVFKLVTNSSWYMITWLSPDSESVVKYKKGNMVRLQFAGREISGTIEDIVDMSDSVLVAMRFSTYFPEVAQQRKVSARVITLDSAGLRISNKSMVSKDGVIGVYVKNLDSQYRFVPVKIMRMDSEYSTVYSGHFEEQVKDDQATDGGVKAQRVETIKPYDEILKNGERGGQND